MSKARELIEAMLGEQGNKGMDAIKSGLSHLAKAKLELDRADEYKLSPKTLKVLRDVRSNVGDMMMRLRKL